MSATDATRYAVRRHVDNIRKWDVEAAAADYAPDAIAMFPNGIVKGRDAISAMFANAPPVTNFVLDSENYDGETALLTYHSDGVDFATDTIVVRDGLIVMQTIALQPSPSARSVAQTWIDHVTEGRGVEAMALLHPNARFEIIGTTPLSGVYHGLDDVMARLMTSMASFPQLPQPSCRHIIAEGDRAVILGSGNGEGPFGPYEQPNYAWSVRVKDGQIIEMTEFLDTVMVETSGYGTTLVRRKEKAA